MTIPAILANRLVSIEQPEMSFENAVLAMAVSTGHRIGVRHETQLGRFWCWAAVSVAMRAFLRKDLPAMSQCQLAKIRLSHPHDCCATPKPVAGCDLEQALEDALKDAGIDTKTPPTTPLADFEMIPELKADRPVCALIDFPGKPNHFVQIDGFQNTAGTLEYLINDPERGELTMSEDDLRDNYHNEKGEWRKTYLLA